MAQAGNPTGGAQRKAGGAVEVGWPRDFESSFRHKKETVEHQTLSFKSEVNPTEVARKRENLIAALKELEGALAEAHKGSGPAPGKQVTLVSKSKDAVAEGKKALAEKK